MLKSKPIIVAYYICDDCKNPILDHQQGFHIMGNIASANPNAVEGFIGNGIWLDSEQVFKDEVPETVLCVRCLAKKLGIQSVGIRKDL